MVGYILTPEQKDEIQGKFYSPYEFFNCVQDIDDDWFIFLTAGDELKIKDTEYDWLLDLPTGEYVPKPSPPPFEQ